MWLLVDPAPWTKGSEVIHYPSVMGKSPARLDRAQRVDERLKEVYPGNARELCALTFETPFQLLAATILSAQCTDVRVNMVTPVLFASFPDARSMAVASQDAVESIVKSTGFFRSKASHLIGMAQHVMHDFGGSVPSDLDQLVTLPGVGRKTGNVVRSVAFDLPGLPVDTHVGRVSRRLSLTSQQDPVKVERDLNKLIEPSQWGGFSLRLILHGRAVCDARKPRCSDCLLSDICPQKGI